MKQKLFTLLTLLLCAVSTTWGDNVYECYHDGSNAINTSTYFSTENTLMGSAYNSNMEIKFTNNNGDEITSSKFTKLTNGKGVNFTVTAGYTASVNIVAVTKDKTSGNGITLKKKNGDNWETVETYTTDVPEKTYTRYEASFSSLAAGEYRMERNSQENAAVYVKVVETAIANYNIIWKAGSHGTAPTSPTSASSFTLPQMDADGDWNNTGWTADQTVKVSGVDIPSGTFLTVGTSLTLTAATTFTGVWQQLSSFVLTSDSEVELTVGGSKSQITYEHNAGTVTYESANPSVATVDVDGKITAVAGGKTTITVSDIGTSTVAADNAIVTVLVPYDNPTAADTYTLTSPELSFSNAAQTKHYFTNGFTITTNAKDGMQYAAIENNTGIKYSHVRTYTINTPSNVTATYLEIEARNNYTTGNTAANWGTVLGTDYSTETLPYSDEDPQTKYFKIENPTAGANLTFSPGGNQWQGYITVHTNAWVAATGVSLNKTSTSIEVGQDETLTATLAPANATNQNVTWTSSDENVATVANGVVTAVAEGEATITATTEDGSFTTTCTVTVTPIVEPVATLPTETKAGYSSSTGSTDISDSDYAMNGRKAYSVSNGGSFTITIPATTIVSKIKVIGTSADNNNASTVTITGVSGESTSQEMNLRKATSITEFEFVPTTQTTTYTIQSTNKGSYLQIAIYGEELVLTPKKQYTTLTSAYNLDFTNVDGLDAYIVKAEDVSESTVTLTQVNKVPAGTGLVLKGTPNTKYTLATYEDEGDDVLGNKMVGSATAETTPATGAAYILSNGEFHPWSGEGNIAAGKAYLNVSVAGGAKALTLNFDNTTGIHSADADNTTAVGTGKMYNLSGQTVGEGYKGIVIVNGKKVIK